MLTPIEEKEIVTACQVMQDLAFPLTKEFVSVVVRDYLKDRGRGERFRNGVPGNDWWLGFFRWHPTLMGWKPEHLPKCRAKAGDPEVSKR